MDPAGAPRAIVAGGEPFDLIDSDHLRACRRHDLSAPARPETAIKHPEHVTAGIGTAFHAGR
jgi:hypothetical protein